MKLHIILWGVVAVLTVRLPSLISTSASPSPPQSPTPASPSPLIPLTPDAIKAQAMQWTVQVVMDIKGTRMAGTGFIHNGYIITCHHVAVNQPNLTVVFSDGREVRAKLVRSDVKVDLAILSVDEKELTSRPSAPIASSPIQLNDTVYALGHPHQKKYQFTTGKIEALEAPCGISIPCLAVPKGMLAPGNSGGPLTNSRGEVIGVNRAIQRDGGAGRSIGVDALKRFLGG